MLPPPSHFEVASSSGASRVPARGTTIRVGRAPDNDIVLSNEPTVSRLHAELVNDNAQWAVRDLGSHNGTHVNGVRLDTEEVRNVGIGDVIGVGNVTIRLVAAEQTADHQ